MALQYPRWDKMLDASGPEVRLGHSAALQNTSHTRRMIVFGGLITSGLTNGCFIVDLETDESSEIFPDNMAPTPRYFHSAVYDPIEDRMIIYGGIDATGTYRSDVWALHSALNGENWVQILPGGVSPLKLAKHAAVYDSRRNRMLVFGGEMQTWLGTTALTNNIWFLNLASGSEAWGFLLPAGAPPCARREHLMIYDEANDRIIVAFGTDATFADLDDCFALDLGTLIWSELTLGLSVQRSGVGVYDSHNGKLIFAHGMAWSGAPVLRVPEDYPTISNAIASASAGNTIVVGPGTYAEHIVIDEEITLISSAGPDTTILDGSGTGHTLTINHPDVIVDGFTITGGHSTATHGGGVSVRSGANDGNLRNCIVSGNDTGWGCGGGIGINGAANFLIDQCIVEDNESLNAGAAWVTRTGGGIFSQNSYGFKITNSIIRNNTARLVAGIAILWTGPALPGKLLEIENSEVVGNYTTGYGGGIVAYGQAAPNDNKYANVAIHGNSAGTGYGGLYVTGAAGSHDVRNCIIYGNIGTPNPNVAASPAGSLTINYSDIEGGYAGVGNIDTDPLFVDPVPAGEDYHLQGVSPCIDAGDPAGAYDDAIPPGQGTARNDMGAYGGPDAAEIDPQGSFVPTTVPITYSSSIAAIDLTLGAEALESYGALFGDVPVDRGKAAGIYDEYNRRVIVTGGEN